MTELSENVSEWPDDPFELLAVARGVSETDLKRSYTRLIRRFKPERFPEQFQKLREAYEQCQFQNRWYRNDTSESATASDSTAEPIVAVTAEPDRAEIAWSQALSGERAAAYATLRTIAQEGRRADVALRLYWLLMIDEALDPDRSRHVWLAEALTAGNLNRRAIDLYRQEIERDPDAALSDAYDAVLALDAAPESILEVATLRIDAAGRTGRSASVTRDLEILQPKLGIDHSGAWLRVLAHAFQWAPLDIRGQSIREYCSREMDRLDHLALDYAFVFDRVEVFVSWCFTPFSKFLPVSLAKFAQAALACHTGIPRAEVFGAIYETDSTPYLLLVRFDDFISKCGHNAAYEMIQTLAIHDVDTPEDNSMPDTMLRAFARSLELERKFNWKEQVRDRVLMWMIRDQIPPFQLVNACLADPDPRYRKLAREVRGDLALYIVWLICKIAMINGLAI
jgi:hypothetical protein